MKFRGLKTLSFVNIAILLLIAMGLVNFILLNFGQGQLINSQILKLELLNAAVENQFDYNSDSTAEPLNLASQKQLKRLLQKISATSLLVLDKQFRPLFFSGRSQLIEKTLNPFIAKAIEEKEGRVDYEGTTWGIFWRQKKNLIVAAPIFSNGVLVGGTGALMPLDPLYRSARQSQKIVFVYVAINAVILALFGLYRISKVYLKPIKRLAKRAEEYTEKEDKPFLVRKEDNDLTQLSQALNNMLLRISQDRKQLQNHIESLEKVNAELRQAQNDIVRAEKYATVGRLASGVAHEIGNPIGIVKGYIELLEQGGANDDEQKDYIIRAKDEINRISTIIRQLLDFSRSSKASSAVVYLHEIITDVAGLIQHQPMMMNIRVTLSLSAAVDCVYADPDQLRQVLLNLIINASDAILSRNNNLQGEILIKSENLPCKKHPHNNSGPFWIKTLIIDNGPGIDKEHIEHVFDPFFTTKEPGKGTGLGLWVCYMIVNNAGGKIRAISQPGEKTILEVYLPLHIGEHLPIRINDHESE